MSKGFCLDNTQNNKSKMAKKKNNMLDFSSSQANANKDNNEIIFYP